jgi:phosphate transport system substrate-binding protein
VNQQSAMRRNDHPMKRRLLSLAVLCALAAVAVATSATGSTQKTAGDELSGAGSSFVFPLVSAWQGPFRSGSGIKVNYNPIGSGGGIKAISARTVDFGASDAPLSPDQVTACNGCVQIPWALSATAIAYKGAGLPNHLKITGTVLADIYLGKITKWNDPALQALNKGVNLPGTKITPIYRSDGSGTSYNFTDYLSAVSPEWKTKVGIGTLPSFPVGVGGAKSAGVAGVLSHTDGGLCYVDVAYTLANHFNFFAVQNADKKFALPGIRGIVSAASTVKSVPANNELHIVNPPKSKANAYPIATFTYIIIPAKTAKAAQLRKFVFWALTAGQDYGKKLLFAPIPHTVLFAAEKTLKTVQS